MTQEKHDTQMEREQTEAVLRKIPVPRWRLYLESDQGQAMSRCIASAREALRVGGYDIGRQSGRPVSEVIDLLGSRLLADRKFGPWLRYEVILSLGKIKRAKLERAYLELASAKNKAEFCNLRSPNRRAMAMSERWYAGSRWAQAYCDITGLPAALSRGRGKTKINNEEVTPSVAQPPLHDFQLEVYNELRKVLERGSGASGMLSLPTGAGKTRVTVDAICDHLAQRRYGSRSPIVLWISHAVELQEQAWECFRQVWQVPPQRIDGDVIRRGEPMKLVRMWGGANIEEIHIDDEPTVLIASVDQLASWVRGSSYLSGPKELIDTLRSCRLACVVVDEAHSVLTDEYRSVLVALGVRAQRQWRMRADAPPLIGLSATPWRKDDRESRALLRFFGKRLLKPDLLGKHPIRTLQRRKILSDVKSRELKVKGSQPMTPQQWKIFDQFRVLPPAYLEMLGREEERNARILNQLLRLSRKKRVIVFACSVEHAKLLVLALNKATDSYCAALVTGKTPRAERHRVIEQFRSGEELRFLCNVGVLTLGFDAPRTDVVCITRPTWSAVAYEQMVGRGLRGPLNGGTEDCLVLDVQDEGLPDQVQSYSRVLELWDG
ncbi:DEAD/DEAH box helicase [Pseudomonadota bacterium]